MDLVADIAAAITHLFYPHICLGCGSDKIGQDSSLCWYCLHELPATGFADQQDNPAEKILWGRLSVEAVHAGFFLNRDSLMEQLLYQLKYKHQKNLGEQLGMLLGAQLKESGRFRADALVPVPLHPKKLRQRGFNQASAICTGVARQLDIPIIENVLIRKNFNRSQTRLGRIGRWENSRSLFGIAHPHRLWNKRILLIDDVLTTGATLESCGQVLAEIPDLKLSIATLCLSSL
ncbi:MAG: ComF family protein [Sphingomonadales bacterium]|nr:ComF family protein [Sphingomonadales bacterium]